LPPLSVHFDWSEFFARPHALEHIEALRSDWSGDYDTVLVDSAAGPGHSAGVCTIQLADAVVIVVRADEASVDAAERTMREIQQARERFDYDRAPIGVIAVLVGSAGAGRDRARDRLAHYCDSWLSTDVDPNLLLDVLTMPASHGNYAATRAVQVAGRIAAVINDVRPARSPESSNDLVAHLLAEVEYLLDQEIQASQVPSINPRLERLRKAIARARELIEEHPPSAAEILNRALSELDATQGARTLREPTG
jgi:MinD-like ATPase involved in chromosome partitioning or flagellar assembly